MYTYEEALAASEKYFDGDDLASRVFVDKYALRNKDGELVEKTPEDMHNRMAKEFARIQKRKYASPLSKKQIFDYFDRFKYICPQGSPMFGIGNKHSITSLSNCYVLNGPNFDSYSSILNTDEQLVNISKRRGGVGICLDVLRPSGTPTKNAAKSSTGVVSWMERFSNSIREVGQNSRRGALMLTLSIHHPDILEFATIKSDNTKVTGANISVMLTDEFRKALKEEGEYELRWPVQGKPKISKMVSAKMVWDTIIHQSWNSAEPGILNWDEVLRGPADCYNEYRSVSTNPCSEIPLSPWDSCRLLALNLLSYVQNPFTEDASFDNRKFYNDVQTAQLLMDDLVDLESEKIDAILAKIESDPEPDELKANEKHMWQGIKRFNDQGRRTGLGITALGDTLAALGIKYGSDESVAVVEEIYRVLKFGSYRASVDMARDFGHFDCWDHELEKNNGYLNRIKEESIDLGDGEIVNGSDIWSEMKQYGRRNVACLTTAPTGSLSILTQTSSGIEPVFMLEYTRRKKINPGDKNSRVDFVDQNGDSWQEFTVYHPTVKRWMSITGKTDVKESPWFGACAGEIDWKNRVALQSEAGKHIDHAISSTINVPEDTTEETIANIYSLAFDLNCKGVTVYRNNCRTGVLVDKSKAAPKMVKRPDNVPCDVHHISVKGSPYFVLVGLIGDVPYEVFAGRNGCVEPEVKTGVIHKMKRPKCYKATFDNESVLQPITAACSDNEEALTRFISMSLRHGAEMQYVVDQLQKTQGPMTSLAKAIARALKKYVKDGVTSSQKCPSCKSNLTYEAGCSVCKNCGHSACS